MRRTQTLYDRRAKPAYGDYREDEQVDVQSSVFEGGMVNDGLSEPTRGACRSRSSPGDKCSRGAVQVRRASYGHQCDYVSQQTHHHE